MPDRESFVAAIATAPEDDLPRLVFADWLDEHGEPDRAEFIRTQIEAERTTDADRKAALERRAADLFAEHWPRWFEPFFAGLPDPRKCYRISRDTYLWTQDGLSPRRRPFVSELWTSRGLVNTIALDASRVPDGFSLGTALGSEPINFLMVELSGDSQEWRRLSEPALRRITSLELGELSTDEATDLPGMRPAFDDPHLAGVRSLTLRSFRRGSDGMSDATRTPAVVIREFERSPLAYRLEALTLWSLNRDGLRVITRSDRLRLTDITFGLSRGIEGAGELIADTRFAPAVQSLQVWDNLGNAGLAAIAASDRWHRLTKLEIPANGITDAGLHALAGASFTPYLEVLNLNGNPLFDDDDDLDGLRELAAALDPHRLVLLDLQLTDLTAVPDFLANRFGDKVIV
ncbi:MAG: TIGR02996 domain-containing protein [Gemmataceae bacterium]